MRRVPALDGLRGVAVLGVLLFHANGALTGGYLGVDLFFVLSGFLITSILIDEHAKAGKIDLRAFWVRRARRLLPALLSLMPAVALYATTLAAPGELARIRGDALATLGYVANWRAVLVGRSYWEMFAAPSPLEHVWSLAIEEQFYIVWPLAVATLLAVSRGRVRSVLLASVLLAVGSAVAMFLLYDGGDATRVYLGTDTRGAAILIGAALATSGLTRAGALDGRLLDTLGILALLTLGAAWFWLDGKNPLLYQGGFWLTEVAGAVLVLCCVRRKSLFTRALSLGPIRALGAISYGVYLWHWPLAVVMTEERLGVAGVGLFASRFVATIAIAALSYRYLERPIRERGLPWGRALVVVPSTFAIAVALILVSTRVGAGHAPLVAKGVPGARTFPPAAELPKDTLRVLVVGDSVGVSLGTVMHAVEAASHAVVAQRSVPDCSILEGIVSVHAMDNRPHGQANCAKNWAADVAELHPDVTLLVLGGAYFSSIETRDGWRWACDRSWQQAYAAQLSARLLDLGTDGGRRIVTLAAYPVGSLQKPGVNERVDCNNGVLRQTAQDLGAEVLDLNEYLCPGGVCMVKSHDAVIRPDGMHFEGLGGEDTARWVFGALGPN